MLKIIGIDPGLADTGIGIVEGINMNISSYSFGCISTKKENTTSKRLFEIYSNISELLKKESPNIMVIEEVFSLPSNPQSGISLARVSGVIMLAAFKQKIPIFEISVKEVKRNLSGNGNATKAQLEIAVRNLLDHKEKISPSHSSDALGLAIIGLYRNSSK